MEKKHAVSDKTGYLLTLNFIKQTYVVKLYYIIDGIKMKIPILNYRINKEEVAQYYFNIIDNIIQTNRESLCIDNMNNWVFNIHPIKQLLINRN
jgi:hypothetical protein